MSRLYVGCAFRRYSVLLDDKCTLLRLVFLTILFLLSLLTIFPAPTRKLWLVAVLITEYSVITIGLTIFLLLNGLHTNCYALLGTIIGLITLFLLLYPIIRAYFIAKQLPIHLEKAFGKHKKTSKSNDKLSSSTPFSFQKLFKIVSNTSFRTFTYVTYEDTSLTLDYYSSIVAGKRPCVLVIHGGSWTSGDSKELSELNSHLVELGYHVASINYRLAPKWRCPAPIEDTVAALNYLRDHADELNIDIENFILLGRSAGGQIALLTAYTYHQLGIKGVIDFYGLTDMIYSYLVPTNPFVLKSERILVRYLGGHYPYIPEKYKASSPIEFVNQNTVPTLILHGAIDPFAYNIHSERLASKLKNNNVSHYFLRLPWGTHGFDYNLNGPSGQLSTYSVEYFLNVITQQ